MSSDLLARSHIWAGTPDEPEYDAVYAAVTATERGRWFLTEYASRNRQADTLALTAAIDRVEAAIRNSPTPAPAPPASPGRDPIEIAAAIERLEAAIGAQRRQASDIAGAVERIEDTAFTLRERAADAALCDALDAAAREISDACAPSNNGASQSHDLTDLLRDLAGRVDMMALAIAGNSARNGATPAAAAHAVIPAPAGVPMNNDEAGAEDEAGTEAGIDSLAQAPLFTMDAQENARLAAAIAALAIRLPPPNVHSEMASQQLSLRAGAVLPPPHYENDPEPSLRDPADQGPRWYIEPPEFAFGTVNRELEKQTVESPQVNGRAQSLLPEMRLLPGPQDDPADLFEPPAAGILTPAAIVPAEPVRPMPRPAPPDPLAGMRALSEEEVIALFG